MRTRILTPGEIIEAGDQYQSHIDKSWVTSIDVGNPVPVTLTYRRPENPTNPNPKDARGETKVSISKFPMIGTVMGAMAMMDGASKYGPYNWRAKDVVAHIYIDAAMRHLMDWFEGQENATDSGVHHLGHAIACCAILLDAQANNNLIDDRPVKRNSQGQPTNADWMEKLLAKLSEQIKSKKA